MSLEHHWEPGRWQGPPHINKAKQNVVLKVQLTYSAYTFVWPFSSSLSSD